MNSTTMTASLSFDFRGQTFKPSAKIDLHKFMLKKRDLKYIYDLLGASIGLDAYRHEYDVMVMEDIIVSQPTGLACDFISGGTLDFDAFSHAWHQQYISAMIQPIAEQHLNISNLDQHIDLQKALIESYKAGQISHLK